MKKEKLIIALILLLVNLTAAVVYFLWKDNFEYAFPQAFYGLFILPLLSIFYFFRESAMQGVVRSAGVSKIPKNTGMATALIRHLPFAFRLLAISLFIIAVARPQSKTSYENMTKEGIDIVLSMDLSGSMLSQDFKPNRLESSKEVAMDFVNDRPDDRIGLVVYEGESFTQVPLTTDHRVLSNALAGLNTGMLEGGTAIGMGLATAISRLKDSDSKSKVVILLTDGVNNSGQVKPLDAAKIAEAFGIRVYTIGVGTTGKAKTPVKKLPDGSFLYDWMEVKIDEDVLKEIAEETGGQYFRATTKAKLREIYKEIDKLEKTKFNVTQYSQKTEEYFGFTLIGIFLLLGDFLSRKIFLRSIT